MSKIAPSNGAPTPVTPQVNKTRRLKPLKRVSQAVAQDETAANGNSVSVAVSDSASVVSNGTGARHVSPANGASLSQQVAADQSNGNGKSAAASPKPLRRLGKLRPTRSPLPSPPAADSNDQNSAVSHSTVGAAANGNTTTDALPDPAASGPKPESVLRRPMRKLQRAAPSQPPPKPAPTERQQIIGGSSSRGLYSSGQGQIDDVVVEDLVATDFSDLSGLLAPPKPVATPLEGGSDQSAAADRSDTVTVAQSNIGTDFEQQVIHLPGSPSIEDDVTPVSSPTLQVAGHGVEFDDGDDDVRLVPPNAASPAPSRSPVTAPSSDVIVSEAYSPTPSVSDSTIPANNSASQIAQQAVPVAPMPMTTGSVPVMHVPVPQFVPISDAGIPQVNSTVGASPETEISETPSRPEVAAKLPDPNDTGAEVTVSDEAGDTREEPEEKTKLSPDEVSAKDRQARAVEAHRYFLQQREQAQEEIRGKQEPFTGKAPRSLAKKLATLEDLSPQDTDEIVKLLRLIGRTESPAAISTFREYSEQRQESVRLTCAEELSKIGDSSASLALLQLLSDSAADVVDAAVKGLLKLGHEESLSPVLALALVHPRLRALVREDLTEADDPSSFEAPLLKIVRNKSSLPDHSAFALNLLSRVSGAEQLKLYNQYTKHPAAELRVAAIDALAVVGEKKGVGIFNKALGDKDATVRSAAATALATLHSPKSIGLLTKALNDPKAIVRRSAAKTLASLESKEVAGTAATVLKKETDPIVVEHLLEIIGKGGGEGALGTLRKYVQGEDLEMRHRAIATLKKLKNPKGAKLLLPLLNNGDRDTRRLTVEALGQLGHMGAAANIREMLIKDPVDQVRAACARALGDLKDESAIEKLEEALNDGRIVQCQALIGMGTIGSEKAQPALLAQLRHSAPEVRYHACNSLAQIGNLSNTQPVEKLLEDKDAMVRRGAENALEKLGVSTGSKVARSVKRTLSSVGSALIPSSLASGIPGGTKGLLTVTAVCMLAVGAFAARGLVSGLGGKSSANIPVTRVKQVCLSPNGKLVYIARSNSCDIWDLEKGELLERFQSGFLNGALFSSSGEEALIFSKKGPATYSMKEGFTPELEGKAEALGQPTSTYYPGDGKSIILAVKDGGGAKLVEYNLDSLEQGKVKPVAATITGRFAVSSAMDTLVVVNGDKANLFLGEQLKKAPVTLELSKLLPSAEGEITDVCFNRDGSLLAMASSQLVIVVEIASGDVKAVLFEEEVGAAQISRISFTDAANTLVAVTNGCTTITATNDFDKVDVKKSPTSGGMSVYDLSPDLGLAAYAEDASKDLFFVDLKQSKVVHMLKGKRQ